MKPLNQSIVIKTSAIVIVVIGILTTAILVATQKLVLHRFSSLEREDANTQVLRVVSEIESTLARLQSFGTDWAYWDDTYQFASGQNDTYVENNLMDETFIEQRLNFMLFYNADGTLVHQQFFNLVNAKATEPDKSTLQVIESLRHRLFQGTDTSAVHKGIVATPAFPVLLISVPVIPSLRNRPASGRLIIGRYLDNEEIEKISSVTHLNASIISMPGKEAWQSQEPPSFKKTQVEVKSDDVLVASTILADVTDQPGCIVSVTLPRTIFHQGYEMWQQHAMAVILLSLCFIIGLIYLLNHLILARLITMEGEVKQLTARRNSRGRLTVQGQDEISRLASEVNRMIDSLEELQEELVLNERYLSELLDTIQCGVITIEADTQKILSINKTGATLLRFDPENMVGRKRQNFIPPGVLDNNIQLRDKERVQLYESMILQADGMALPVIKSTTSLRNKDRDYFIESFVDIRSLKQVEADLRASEERYRQFFENDITGDFICTPKGHILECNQAFVQLLGFDNAEDAKRSNLFDFFYIESDRWAIFDCIESTGHKERMEWKLRHRNGQPVYCTGNAIVHRDTNGQTQEYQVYLFDETRRVLLEREVRQNQKLEAIGTLAGGIAHDFNNILAGIVGFAELGMKNSKENVQLQNYLHNILVASEKARELIYQIMVFSRKSDTKVQVISLRVLIEEILRLMRATLPATITIESHLHAEGIVLADPVQIHQVLINMCANAGHAMRQNGGVLTVILDERIPDQTSQIRYPLLTDENFACVSLIDTGHGIPPDILNRIFDPFFTTKSKEEGTGLGLSMVHGIIQSLKGAITVESTPGSGTRFDIFIPLSKQSLTVAPIANPIIDKGNEHIVFIDDEPFLVEIGREILTGLGYQVTAFMESDRALDFIRQHHADVDLLISDYTMPNMTGLELARRLREEQILTPMIICTGYRQDLDDENMKLLGIHKVLIKPISEKNWHPLFAMSLTISRVYF